MKATSSYLSWLDDVEAGEADQQMNEAIMLVALTDSDQVGFVTEKLDASQRSFLTLPTAHVTTRQAPDDVAKRHLRKETGYQARDFQMMGILYPSTSLAQGRFRVFLAQHLALALCSEDQRLASLVYEIPCSQIDRLIMSRQVRDTLVIAALHLVQHHLAVD